MPSIPKKSADIFNDFRKMQDRHLEVLTGKDAFSISELIDERRGMLQRLKNWFASEGPVSVDPAFLKEELKAVLDKEEQLKKQANGRYREMQSEIKSVRVGKKMVNGYREKGYGLGSSPHFVSRSA